MCWLIVVRSLRERTGRNMTMQRVAASRANVPRQFRHDATAIVLQGSQYCYAHEALSLKCDYASTALQVQSHVTTLILSRIKTIDVRWRS